MDWSRIMRLWAYPGRNRTARARWEYIGRRRADAVHMMDGSRDEGELRRRGGRMARILAAALGIDGEQRVLEVGCGLARVGREMAPLCATYTGADISSSLLRRAALRTRHLDNVTLHHLAGPDEAGDGLAGLADGAWDRAYCHLVMLHLDEAAVLSLLHGFGRVLAADGLVYFDLWNRHHPDVADLARREAADPSLRRQPHRSRFYDRRQVEGWLAQVALEPLWIRDESFLVQVVAAGPHASATAETAARARLARNGLDLIPRGHLDFEIAAVEPDPGTEKDRGAGPARP